MKRSEALQPLSREHHKALTLAKACERAADSGSTERVASLCQRAIRAYTNELEPHFLTEERSLLPLLKSAETQPLVQRTLADHHQLRALLEDLRLINSVALGEFGKRLSAHVRFEERELFPALEKVLILPVPHALSIF